jgi:exonuclease VII large subunit
MGLSGTLTNPFSVEDAIAYCQTLSGETANDFFVKGKISKIEVDKNGVSQEFGSYGNATFWISSDGNFNDDLTKDFECYRVLWLGNQKWAEGNAQISVGDEVIICGKLTLYKGTAETSGNKAYIYSINGVTTDVNGIGSLAAPFNIAGAMNCIDNGWTGDVFVQGIVSKFANNGEFGAKYGNGTFWISDDGTFNDDLTKDFEAYRVLWLGNKKWEEGDDQLHVGDKVILHGQLTKYGSTYETNQNKAYVYEVSHLAQ